MKLTISLIKRHPLGFFSAIFFLTIEALGDLLQPAMMARMVDQGVANRDMTVIVHIGLTMLGVALIGAGAAVARNIIASNISQRIGKELRSDIYRKIQSFSFENIDRLEPASLVTRLTNDVTQIQNFINGCMRILVKAPITCVGAIIVIVTQTPSDAPIVGGILLIAAILIISNMKLGYPRFGRVQRMLDKLNTNSREYLNSVRVVKAFGRESHEYQRFSDSADHLADASVSASRVNASFGPAINLTVNLGIVLLLWLGSYHASGTLQVGKPMASVNYMTQILFALGMVSNILNMMVRATASSERIGEVLNEKPALSEPVAAQSPDLSLGLVFQDVSFTYAGAGCPSLTDIDFKADAGTTVGIIGPTGSGKSTLINLIPRFYDPDRGKILVGGVDIRKIHSATLRNHIAVVPQKSVLFTGTIADNLRWGDKEASDEKVFAAAKAACADSFVRSFTEGYHTMIGQGGVNLSGGQKQRLSIARALLRSPDILILDDCTSALDATTEVAVREGIRNQFQHITTFIISQRISSIMTADKIIVVDNGRIVGIGAHAMLMEQCPMYGDIYRSQIGGVDCGN